MKTVILKEHNIVILEDIDIDTVILVFKNSNILGMITKLVNGWCLKKPERNPDMYFKERNKLVKHLIEHNYIIKTL